LCWLLLWVGINTGPGNLDLDLIEGSWTGFFNGVRAAFPILVLAAWIIHILLRKVRVIRCFTWPEGLWFYYGVVCLIASSYVEPWFDYAYWGFAYLSALAATEIYMQQSSTPERAARLNRLNWVFGAVVLGIVVWVARGALLEQTSMGISGYGILSRMATIGGMPMVRASGISRLAAVPAIVAFVLCGNTRGTLRFIWVAVFSSGAYLVWVMQSRGSLVSFAVALIFVMFLMEGRQRWFVILAGLILGTVYVGGFVPDRIVHHLWLYSMRGEQDQELASMSGRTRIFDAAWQLIKAAPFIGYGPQADRQLTIVGNAQNAGLYALLGGGFLGGVGFIGGLAFSWVLLMRAFRRRHLMTKSERTTLLQVAGVLAFMTMRSYPENCSALFSVDLLLQLPARVYLGELERAFKRQRAASQDCREASISIPAFPAAQVR
jgi:O-antigen ligase